MFAEYQFHAEKFIEDDGSVTLALVEIDLVENAKTEAEAKRMLAKSIMEYAQDYYNEYALYSKAPNRKAHIPFVFKALLIDNIGKLGDKIIC